MSKVSKIGAWLGKFEPADLELPQWRRRLATLIGAVLVGLIALFFARSGDLAQQGFARLAKGYPYLALVLPPAMFAAVAWLTGRFALEARGSGIPQVIAAARDPDGEAERGLTSLRVAGAKLVLTIAALFGGASVGREGPTVQLGAAVMVAAHRLLRVRVTPGVLIAGAAAGVAAAFNTPLAGIAFAIEELAVAYEQRVAVLAMGAVMISGLTAQGLAGDYTLAGPSLAAVGEPLGVTLPTTPAFSMRGRLTRDGTRWTTAVRQATIGKSQLSGEFQYDKPENAVPSLTGELRGRELWLADLGPAVGVPAEPGAPRTKKAASRVLPDKQFDLPSLRAMNANVNVKLARFESGSALLQAAEPLNARIVLQDGVLELRDIDARVARGQVAGLMRLDGREPKAQWRARLRVSGVHLEQWLNLERKNGQRWVNGVMGGRIALDGVGRSTAELLASADGRMVLYWTDGTVSHLIVEAAGIDIAQGLGLLVRGDDALQVNCGVADLRVKDGMVTPRPMVVDTKDSVVLVDGDMSLATERLNLVAKVDPKDRSPLTLRTPLNIQGTLGDPRLSLQKAPLLRKLVPAAVLGVAVAPLAAIVPLIDLGEDPDDESLRALSECNARLAPVSKRRPGS